MEYSEKVVDHYTNPRNVGKIEDASGIGEVGNPVCGDIMKMFIKVENNIIVDLLFFGLKEYNAMKLISCILIGIKKLIIMEENIMSDDSIKRMIKEKGIEDFLEKELSGKRFNDEQENTAEIIIDAIKDEDIELPRNNK